MKRMQNGMPGGIGNALSFGKANAKIYVEAQTGKTFGDVAGQDEAKEALLEIVDFLHNPDALRRDRREAAQGRAACRPARYG